MEKSIQFRKNFIWNILGTGFNSFTSLFFMIIATRINGIDEAGIFTLAFSTACILYSFGIYVGRIYQVTELDKEITDKDFIINRLITTLLMPVSLLFFCIFRGYNAEKTIIFLLLTLYKALDAFSDVIYGILQKNDELHIAGKSLFIKSLFSIIIFLIVDIIIKNMTIAIISMIIVCILIFIIYDYRKAKQLINFKVKVNLKNVFSIFKKGFFVFAISFLSMYVLNSPKYAIDTYLQENYQTIFGIIVMPATVIGLISTFLIHPYLNDILELYEKGKEKEFNKMLLKIIICITIIGIISTIIAYLIGTQFLGLIYGIDLSAHKIELAVIIISATIYTMGTICSSFLTVVRETFSQFIIYVIVSVFALFVSNILVSIYKIEGAVIAYFLIMLTQFLLYIIYTKIRMKQIFSRKIKENEINEQ